MTGRILAAIDIGTNSFHLVIARIEKGNRFTVLTKNKEVVRLGTSSNDMKYISSESIERGISTLKRFKLICETFNAEIRAIATSAVREALNKLEFTERAFNETGINIEIISGYEEARLIYLGILQALPVYNKRILLIDIGGGSTEFLIGYQGENIYARSIKIGAVRLTQKFKLNKDLSDKNIENARLFIKGALYPLIRELKNYKFEELIGSSGTIQNIAAIINAKEKPEAEDFLVLNGYKYDSESLKNVVKKLLKSGDIDKIKKIPGLDEKRADIIVAGALILDQIFSEFNFTEITVSNYALREGIILDTINKDVGPNRYSHLSDVRYNSIIHLGEMTNFEKEHALQVQDIATKLFDALKTQFTLDNEDEEILEAAAILHDIGYYISHTDHHKHSYYLIRNSEMLGFNDNEIEIIANVARYHRKSHPKIKHEGYKKLDVNGRIRVNKLSAILRLADGLDRSHKSIIKDLSINQEKDVLNIALTAETNPELEIWGAERRKDLFEEVFKVKLNFTFRLLEKPMSKIQNSTLT
jgi:exopolyphosphatase/guanosine-5'-triphosphate,3'-diphosphate pyrophosphatase